MVHRSRAPDISIHAPHTGRDRGHDLPAQGGGPHFNPRAPYGARHTPGAWWMPACPYFNPRAPYGARQRVPSAFLTGPGISIHAPHTGRDLPTLALTPAQQRFQSTRPIRGATEISGLDLEDVLYFNPRAPYGARLSAAYPVPWNKYISIHAPHTGRDKLMRVKTIGPIGFQSTRPIRGATLSRVF